LDAAGIEAGPIFRPINRAGTVSGERLTDRSVANIVKAYVLSCSRIMREQAYCNAHLAPGTGILKIGKALGIGTGTVQRVY
jgi:hypothetical protein